MHPLASTAEPHLAHWFGRSQRWCDLRTSLGRRLREKNPFLLCGSAVHKGGGPECRGVGQPTPEEGAGPSPTARACRPDCGRQVLSRPRGPCEHPPRKGRTRPGIHAFVEENVSFQRVRGQRRREARPARGPFPFRPAAAPPCLSSHWPLALTQGGGGEAGLPAGATGRVSVCTMLSPTPLTRASKFQYSSARSA